MEKLKPLEESLDDLKDELCKYAKEIYLTAYEDGAQAREFFEDGLNAEFAERIGSIVDDWNRRASPENKPLTVKQLRQMDGEPVYIVYSRFPEDNEWKVLKGINAEPDDDGDTGAWFSDDEWESLKGYGHGWLAYARRPEGSENDV